MAEERKKKLEDLRKRRAERKEMEEMNNAGRRHADPVVTHQPSVNLIDHIVNQPLTSVKQWADNTKEGGGNQVQLGFPSQHMQRTPCSLSTHIADIHINPVTRAEKYCHSINMTSLEVMPGKLGRRGNIDDLDSDDDAFHSDNSDGPNFDRMEQMQKRRQSSIKGRSSLHQVRTGIQTAGSVDSPDKKQPNMREQNFTTFEIMSREDAKLTMKQKDFGEFFAKSSRLIERALGQEFDLAGNFFEAIDETNEDDEKVQKGDRCKYQFTFGQTEPIKRAITSIDWSPSPDHGELFLASMSKCNEWRFDEPDGRIDLYSLSLRTRPEMTLTCQYEVTKAMFHPHKPNMVIGATQCGYLLQWDTRAGTHPTQKSCLAHHSHQYPVYCLNLVGSENNSSIVSISNDGWLCSWKSQHGFHEPKKYSYLEIPPHLRPKEQDTPGTINSVPFATQAAQQDNSRNNVNSHCMDFPDGEIDRFYVGSEDYNIYQGFLHQPESGENVDRVYKGHFGPVTQVHVHPGFSQSERHSEMSDLFLSSSFDWTVNLWHNKSEKPIKTFESSQEYVFDVQWSPTHPGVFGSVDAEGYLDVWDINSQTDAPIVRKRINEKKPLPLNALKWSRDGRRIATGDSEGFISIMKVDADLAVPKTEDFDKIQKFAMPDMLEDEDEDL